MRLHAVVVAAVSLLVLSFSCAQKVPKAPPKAGTVKINPKDSAEMVRVPEGEFLRTLITLCPLALLPFAPPRSGGRNA